jgi:hypothetical protein
MAKTISPRQDFDEHTEIFNARNGTIINFSNLNSSRVTFNQSHGFIRPFRIGRSNCNVAFIVNFNNCSSGFLDVADIFTAWSNECTNFIWVDLCTH